MPCSTAQLFHSPPKVKMQNINIISSQKDHRLQNKLLNKGVNFRCMPNKGKEGKEWKSREEREVLLVVKVSHLS